MGKMRLGRIIAVWVIFAILISFVVGKLAYEQLVNGQKLEYGALNTRLRELPIKPNRGVIYDRNGSALAISIATETLYINPTIIRKSGKSEEVANALGEILKIDVESIRAKIEKNTSFEFIKRHVDDEMVEQIRQLKYSGVYFQEETKRAYPKGSLASHIIGFAGIDNQGLNGLEVKYESELVGVPGKFLVEYDGKGQEIPQAIQKFVPAQAGNDLYLTIDETIQYIAEREIEKVAQEQRAKAVTAIVMDVKTGALLAIANYPDYDPNNYSEVDESVWSNFAVSGIYEPGSTFKILSSAMFLEEGATGLEDRYYCPGYHMVGKERIKCWKTAGHGSQSFVEGVANSCNPVMAVAVERLGKEKFYDYMAGFGLTQKTGIDLPGEGLGLTVSESRMVPRDLASMAIGQANAFTPIQMITAISAIANGGNLMEPYVVEKIMDSEGRIIQQHEPKIVRQVVSEKTAKEMWTVLENVVSNGTGSRGKVEGYLVAGKTGTAQKPLATGGYSKEDFIVSFAGFAPANEPEIACLVLVDTPQNENMGGVVAGPVFSNIMEDALRYLQVPKSIVMDKTKTIIEEEKMKVPQLNTTNPMEAIELLIDAGLNPVVEIQGEQLYAYLPPADTIITKGGTVYLYCKNDTGSIVVVPDLQGKTIKEVDKIISGLGLSVIIEGSGLAQSQYPISGTEVEIGSSITVVFSTTSSSDAESDELADLLEFPQ